MDCTGATCKKQLCIVLSQFLIGKGKRNKKSVQLSIWGWSAARVAAGIRVKR